MPDSSSSTAPWIPAEAASFIERHVARFDGMTLDALDAETLALAGTIAKAPRFAMKLMKRGFERALDAQGLTQSLQAAFDLHQLAHATSEQVELTRQFSVRQQIESVKTASKG